MRKLAAFFMENYRDNDGYNGKAGAKFRGEVFCRQRWARERIEKRLNENIMARVKEHARPDAAAFEAHPGEEEADTDDHHRETHERIPRGASTMIIGEQNQWIVPERPNHAAGESYAAEGHDFGQLRNEESAPA